MEQKKATRAQLEKRIDNALLIVDKGKEFKSIYLGDIGIGVYITKDYAIMTSNFHQHIWNKFNRQGYNKPYIYLDQFVNLANEHINEIGDKNIEDELFYSMRKLIAISTLSESEKILIGMVYRFIYVANSGIYAIGNENIENTNLLLQYSCWLSYSNVFFEIKDEDVLRNDIYNKFISEFRYNSLDKDIDKKFENKLKEKINEVEGNAYNQIKKFINENGGKMIDTVALPKRTDEDEVQALKEIMS